MDPPAYFSDSYQVARSRFVDALNNAGYSHEAHAITARGPSGEELTIDIGLRGPTTSKRTLTISSGLHGVEGFFGSAVQLALLQDPDWLRDTANISVVMIHALNPFGFAWKRRWNEDNVDLNRSFFSEADERPQTLPAFHKIDAVLNPKQPPDRFDLFPLKAMWYIARHGFVELKRTLPVGQYVNPLGLFYGGHAPSATQTILEQNLPRWVGSAVDVVHLDFHTGLGPSREYALLLGSAVDEADLAVLNRRFSAKVMGNTTVKNPRDALDGQARRTGSSPFRRFLARSSTAYPAHGLMSVWLEKLFPGVRYLALSAEFGTYPAIRVLKSLIAENQSYHWDRHGDSMTAASNELIEMFAPSAPDWRASAISNARKICMEAISG